MSDETYDVYDALRTRSPVMWNEVASSWMVFRHRDVVDALRNPALSSGARVIAMEREFAATLSPARARRVAEVFGLQMETSDAPAHPRIRQAFAPSLHAAASRLDPYVRTVLREMPRPPAVPLPFDLITGVANPLPLQVVLAALGVVPAARHAFARDVATFLRQLSDPSVDGDAALARLQQQIRMADRGILAAVTAQKTPLDEREVVANAVLIVSAGHRTTTNLIGSLLYLLLRDRPVLQLITANAGLIPRAIDEALRLESPIQTLQRTALTATVIGGVKIAQGDTVILVLGAANRDPTVFTFPEKFDLQRRPNRHLAFGHGGHFCLGAALARMQAAAVVERLLPDLLDLVVREAVWNGDTAARGLTRLVVDRDQARSPMRVC